MSKLDEIKDEIKKSNDKSEEIENRIADEAKSYGKDLKNMDFKEDDTQPILQKICFVFVGISNFFVGFALYFLFKSRKKNAWQNKYLLVGGYLGILVQLIITIGQILEKVNI